MSALATLTLAGCTLRPWTPGVSVAYWAAPVPQAQPTSLPTADDLAARWALPPGVTWSRYQKLTLIGSLQEMPGGTPLPRTTGLQVVVDAEDAAESLAKQQIPSDAMIVLDLRGAAAVAFGARLSQSSSQLIAPVMTFNHWPAEEEVIPAEETLAALIEHTPKLPVVTSAAPGGEVDATPVFMLDSWRLAYRYTPVADDTTDNRYMLTTADLPSPQDLAAKRIRRVIYVVESLEATSQEEDDLHAAFLAYQNEGISIHLVDLAWVRALAGPVDWSARLALRVMTIEPRTTLVDDPSFYALAQGGFGGPYAVPSGGGGVGGRFTWGGRTG